MKTEKVVNKKQAGKDNETVSERFNEDRTIHLLKRKIDGKLCIKIGKYYISRSGKSVNEIYIWLTEEEFSELLNMSY